MGGQNEQYCRHAEEINAKFSIANGITELSFFRPAKWRFPQLFSPKTGYGGP